MPAQPMSEVSDWLGVDLGQVHIAVDSEGQCYNNANIDVKRVQSNDRRNALKKVKTKNSRRALKKMSRKQSRFGKDVNHCISKKLVQKAKALGIGISMEALEDFAPKKKVSRDKAGKVIKQSKRMGRYRAKRKSWSFFQLREFVSYKALREGVPLVFINSKYTSQECSVCHVIDERNRTSQACFCCVSCGHAENADVNAAKNIKFRVGVNLPEFYPLKSWIEGEAATLRLNKIHRKKTLDESNASAASPCL